MPKLGKIFISFYGFHTPPLHRWGEIWRVNRYGRLFHAKFHPIGATCHPCGAKNLKMTLQVTYIPVYALRASRR